MPEVHRRTSRTRAALVGGVTGLVIAVGAVLFFLAATAHRSAYFASHGLTPTAMIFIALPGTLAIGSIVAFPTSAAMVWFTTAVSRKVSIFDTAPVWITSGAIFALPTAYFFSTMQPGRDQFALVSLWSMFLIVGAVSGLAAWLFRHSNSNIL